MANSLSTSSKSDSYIDYLHLMEHLEANVREKIDRLSISDLEQDRSSLIARFLPGLIIGVPSVTWSKARHRCVQLGPKEWQHSLTVPIDDPSTILWSVEWSVGTGAKVECEANAERGVLAVIESITALNAVDSQKAFMDDVARFKVNLLKSQMEFERYNAALPYLICFWAEARCGGLHKGRHN